MPRISAGVAARDRIIFPLDVSSISSGLGLVEKLEPHVGKFKIGFEFIYATFATLLTNDIGKAYEELQDLRRLFARISLAKQFFDTKFNDIPHTVGKASLAVSGMGVSMFNLHASAGRKAIEAAVANKGLSKVFGVTVLTSIDPQECEESIFGEAPGKKVERFAQMLLDAGADGVICSPQEVELLRSLSKFDVLEIACPGIRPEWSPKQDQKRTLTPTEGVKVGVNWFICGRPIREAMDPAAAAIKIAEEIAAA